MKKIISLFLSLFVISFSFANNYNKLIDKCCLINYEHYQDKLNQVSYILETKYPNSKKYLDNLVFKIVWIVSKKYPSKKSEIYQKLADKLVSYAYNHNIYKWTKTYYKLAYLIYTFKYYSDFYKKKNNFELLIENIEQN